ncbi:MAG TPA: hypothetical protein VM680_06795 [Verrucomicrobiae bacterium]|nr:hypothetical protein [Verrucomicrobiae bacterium]
MVACLLERRAVHPIAVSAADAGLGLRHNAALACVSRKFQSPLAPPKNVPHHSFTMPPPHPVAEILRDITSARKRPWILILLGFFLICAAWKTKLGAPREPKRPPDTIEYHYTEWRRHVTAVSRGTPTDRFSIRAILARIESKISPRERHELITEHENALIRLGYFDDFRFDTKGADVGKLMSQFYTNTLNTDLHIYYFRISILLSGQKTIQITAPKEDIPKLAAIFRQLVSADTNR